jgi:hypothetical protein
VEDIDKLKEMDVAFYSNLLGYKSTNFSAAAATRI